MPRHELSVDEHTTDEDLAKRSLKDKGAFGVLVDRYEKRLGAYIHRLARVNKEEKEDLLQEVFLKAYLNLNSFDPTLKFSSWIYRITHNQVISSFRKKSARPESVFADNGDVFINRIVGEIDLEKEVDQNYLKEQIDTVLKKLDRKYCDIIILKYLEEKSYKEISDVLQIPEGTVAIRLNRAKKALKKYIAKHTIV